jgi:hypothetical protein
MLNLQSIESNVIILLGVPRFIPCVILLNGNNQKI